MLSFLSKPLAVTITALAVAAVAGVVIVPNVGNPPAASLLPPPAPAPSTAVLPGVIAAADASSGAIQLSFPVSGRVGAVNVAAGDTVKKGDILAALDTSVAASAVGQAKAALDLAQAQYASANLQYANAKTQQDTLVKNAYRTLLSSGLEARATGNLDESHEPTVSGTYSCDKEGSYEIAPYSSGVLSTYSFSVHGLEETSGNVTLGTPQPLGSCGLFITFVPGFSTGSKWVVEIPNHSSSSYQANKNAYDLAVATRDQTLSQLAASIGQNSAAPGADVASASVSVAKAAYQSALAQYQNDIIASPADGTVTFIDASLKPGQSVSAGQRVLAITAQ